MRGRRGGGVALEQLKKTPTVAASNLSTEKVSPAGDRTTPSVQNKFLA